MLIENLLARYYEQIGEALRRLLGDEPGGLDFAPGVELPELTPGVREYLAVSSAAHCPLPSYRGRKLSLLDLTRNPATMTTKTFASLVIVARAIHHIRETGERITIVTPSSANKATAMRDAVLRAISADLVTPDELNVVAVVPQGSVPKLRRSELFTDPQLRRRNPIGVYGGERPGTVKEIARGFVDAHREWYREQHKTQLWYTLRLENYLAADVVRALAEEQFFPAPPDSPRLHVHAVSSAYGLLGHDYGRSLLSAQARARSLPSRYYLVQHLGAPDMVLSLYHEGATDPALVPAYSYDERQGLFTQDDDPHFPRVTADAQESLDPTFYTRTPPTSARMDPIIRRQGGGGIVVSRAECLLRYDEVRDLLRGALGLPDDPAGLREWSVVMAMVGLLNGIDRGLVEEDEILVHGSGCYGIGDYEPLTMRDVHQVGDADALHNVASQAGA